MKRAKDSKTENEQNSDILYDELTKMRLNDLMSWDRIGLEERFIHLRGFSKTGLH